MQHDTLYPLCHLTRRQRSNDTKPHFAKPVPSHEFLNNSNSHASEAVIADECLGLINCGHSLSTLACGSVCSHESAHSSVCVCIVFTHVPVWAVRVCANSKSMSLLIPIRDVALLRFGGMGPRSWSGQPRLPVISQNSMLPFSAKFSLHLPPTVSVTIPSHTIGTELFSQLIYLFIHSFIFLMTFQLVAFFFFLCDWTNWEEGPNGNREWFHPLVMQRRKLIFWKEG